MNRKAIFSALLVTGVILLAVGATQMGGGRGMGGRRFGRGPSLAEASAKLGLTESKQRQIDQILSAEQRAVDAGDEGDTERGDRRGRRSSNRRALEQFKQVLNEQEYAQLEKLLAAPGRAEKVGRFFRELQSIGLNIKQEAMVEKIMDEAMAKVQSSLTLDQRSKLTAALERPESGFGGERGEQMRQRWRQLSPEQREELAKEQEKYWEKMSEAETPQERRELREEMQRKIGEIRDGSREPAEEESSEEPSKEGEEETE